MQSTAIQGPSAFNVALEDPPGRARKNSGQETVQQLLVVGGAWGSYSGDLPKNGVVVQRSWQISILSEPPPTGKGKIVKENQPSVLRGNYENKFKAILKS